MIHVHELDVLKLMKIWDSFWCKNPDPYKMTRNRIYVYRLYPELGLAQGLIIAPTLPPEPCHPQEGV